MLASLKNYDEIAMSVLRKYSYNKKVIHGQRVANYSMRLYELLCEKSEFEESDRLILRYASLLHDIGRFISKEKHHKHGKYLILKDQDLNMIPLDLRSDIAILISSHRKKVDTDVNNYSREKREKLFKLVSILRVADALDLNEINEIVTGMNVEKNSVLVQLVDNKNLIECEKFNKKSELFKELFGMNIVFN